MRGELRMARFFAIAALCVLISACGGTNPLRKDASLSDLVLEGITLEPAFSPGVSSYSAEVGAAADTTWVTPTARVSSARIEVNGQPVISGSSSGPIALAPGVNAISIVVTARDRETQRTYTVNVTRRATSSTNADLANLELTATDLDQIFDPALTSYTAALGYIGASTRVMAVADDPFATVAIDGEPIAADEPSGLIVLAPGTNVLDVVVTAEDGTTMRTYRVEVDRGALVGVQQEAYVKASNPDADRFGASLSMSRDMLAVGAPEEAGGSPGVDGDETDNSSVESGAAYVFERFGGTWMQAAYVKASNPDPRDRFGDSLVVHGDTLVIGAPGEQSLAPGVGGDELDNGGNAVGAAYVLERDGMGVWDQTAYLKASNSASGDEFGSAVDLDGDRLIVGAPFEDSGATGVNGDEDDQSARDAGAAYLFRRGPDGDWQQEAYVKASNTGDGDELGGAVAISGQLAAVAASGENGGAAGVDGDELDNSLLDAGAVYLFERDDSDRWSQVAYIKASNPDSNDRFGASIALDGNLLVVGAPGEDSAALGVDGNELDNSRSDAGAAYVFERDTDGDWFQVAYIKATNTGDDDFFGSAVALQGNVLAVGAPGENSSATGIDGDELDNSLANAGATYVFERGDDGVWQQIAYVKASNAGSGDEFGGAVAVGGETLAAGATGESSASAGIDGDQSDNSLNAAGAVYVIR